MGDDSKRAIGDLTVIVHALLRRLGTDDVTLTSDEIYRAAEDAGKREILVIEDSERLMRGEVRIQSWLRFTAPATGPKPEPQAYCPGCLGVDGCGC